MDQTELDNRFRYHPPTVVQQATYQDIRHHARTFATWLNDVLPESREKAQALTDLDDLVMHANAAVARRT